MDLDKTGTIKRLNIYREVKDQLIENYNGNIANTTDDSMVAEFSRIVKAAECSVMIQENFASLSYDKW
jgi:hypothetical protein